MMRLQQGKSRWNVVVSLFIVVIIIAYFMESLFIFVVKTRAEKVQAQVSLLTDRLSDYYVRHDNTWPDSLEDVLDSENQKLFSQFTFLPAKKGQHYAQLALLLPDSEVVEKFARVIPMAYYDEKSTSLIFVITEPLARQNRTQLIVKNIYGVDAKGEQGVQLTKPHCPPGWNADYKAVQRWWFNTAVGKGVLWPHNAIGIEGVEVKNLAPWFPAIKTHHWDGSGAVDQGQLTIISYCIPPAMDGRPYDPTFDYYRGATS